MVIKSPLIDQWFVGREEYLEEFKAFLRDERGYHVLYVHGPGGIGKTWLLRKMMATVPDEIPNLLVVDDLIDMYSTANHSIEGLQERLITLLEGVLGSQAFKEYRQSQNELATGIRAGFREEILNTMRQNLQQEFLEDCRKLSENKIVVLFFDTFERVQRDRVGSWVLTELARDLSKFRLVVASREPWGGNTIVHTRALEGFSPTEALAYFERRGVKEREVLNVLQEKTSGYPLKIELTLDFLNRDMLRDIQGLRSLTQVAFEKALIDPLKEMGVGLFGLPDFDEAIHQTILFMSYFNRRFNADLLQLLVSKDVVDLKSLLPHKVLDKLKDEFFFVKTRPDGYIQLHDEMERLINKYLWGEIDRSGEFRRELAEIACQWYEIQIQQAEEGETKDETAIDDLRAEHLTYLIDANLERATARLVTYRHDSFTYNNLLVVEIKPEKIREFPLEYRYRFATDLGDRARRVYLYERGQEYWLIAVEAARQNDNPDQEVESLLGLHNCTHPLDLKKSLKILEEEAFPLCDQNETRRVDVLYEIGFTYSRLQKIQQAIDWYEKARNAAKDAEWMAKILNDMGYTYVFLGEYKRAGRYVKRGLQLRRERVKHLEGLRSDMRKQIESGVKELDIDFRQQMEKLESDLLKPRWMLGLSFNTLGQIKRFDGDQAAATGAYSEALDIFSREDVNDYLWQARALHSRAEAHRRIAVILFEQDRFHACNDYEERARKDIQDCLALCDQFGFEKHTANRRMGRLLHDQALRTNVPKNRLDFLAQARDYFEKGFQAAIDDDNALEELENLTELAFLVDDRLDARKQLADDKSLSKEQIRDGEKDIERLRKGLERHRKDSFVIYQFQVFAHLLELEEGAFCFVQGDRLFDEALKYYLEGYAGLARIPGYGTARYRQHLGHLFNQLKKIENPDVVRKWGKAFIKEWTETRVKPVDSKQPEQTLAQLHPELVEEMQIYLDTAFLPQE